MCEITRRKYRTNASGHWDGKGFFGIRTKTTGNKGKNRQTELHKTKNLLHSKRR
jgi:hypothetical protein